MTERWTELGFYIPMLAHFSYSVGGSTSPDQVQQQTSLGDAQIEMAAIYLVEM